MALYCTRTRFYHIKLLKSASPFKERLTEIWSTDQGKEDKEISKQQEQIAVTIFLDADGNVTGSQPAAGNSDTE